jgi:pimeloyl-ACP methyl ester carboxylesterase
VDGIRLFCRVPEVVPQYLAPQLVLVHGLGVSSRYMIPLLRELAPLYRVWAPDLPGFGRSQRTPDVPDIHTLARWLRKWLAAAGLAQAVFIGNSMGCQIIAELAATVDPACVTAAILLGPTMDRHANRPQAHVFRLLKDQFREPASLVPLQAFDYLTNGPIRTIRTFLHALRHDTLLAFSEMKNPALFIRGEHDEIVSAVWVEELAQAAQKGVVITVPNAGHALNYNSPREVTRAVQQFLDELGFSQPRAR